MFKIINSNRSTTFYFLNIILLMAVCAIFPSEISAQVNVVPSMACLGNCPTPTPIIKYRHQEQYPGNRTTGQTTEQGNNDTRTASSSPCQQAGLNTAETETFHNNNEKYKKPKAKKKDGLFKLLLQLIQIMLQLLQQLLGINITIIPDSPTPPATITPTGSTVNPTVTLPPCPTITPTILPTTQPSQEPTSPQSSLMPSVSPTTTITNSPTQNITPTATITPIQSIIPTEDGLNYSGYYFKTPNIAKGDSITTMFSAVPATCGTGMIAPWPGMGDTWDVENNLAQLGIDIECQNGVVKYSAWTEALPAGSIYPPDTPINQNDNITTKIIYDGNGKFITNITNTTAGWTVNTPMNYSVSYVPVGIEMINEEVGDRGIMPFSPITFSNTLILNNLDTPIETMPGLTRLNMNKVNTSDLTNSDFTSTYTGP